jgi:uncharacterized protein (TIGR02284 family)
MAGLKQTIKIVQDLIDSCGDGQNGYRDAAEHVTDSNLRHFFNQASLERAGFAGELEQELINLGEADPGRTGTVGAAARRAWIDVTAVLGGGDRAILRSVETGEAAARKSYEKALEKKEVPEHLAMLIRRQLASIAAAYDHVCSLRDTKAA